MNHALEEQLVDAYYGELDPRLREHLSGCDECRLAFERIKETLDSVREYPVPERDASYGGQVWTRILPSLPEKKSHRTWLRWWTLVPATAVIAAIAFFAGMLTQSRREPGFSPEARQRVLLAALTTHLERSQILLTELVNDSGVRNDWTGERERARDLADENRLLRQTALHLKDGADAALLDDLERVLLDIANSPSGFTSEQLANVRERIENEGLLFKVRITSADARRKEQKL